MITTQRVQIWKSGPAACFIQLLLHKICVAVPIPPFHEYFCSPEMSKAPGAVLSIVCSSCLQAFHLRSGPSHRNNDDPVLSLSLSYSQFSSVLIIVPQLQELPHYQDRREREREGEEKTGRDKKRERERDRKKSALEGGKRANLQGGRGERMTKYKDG